jgi:hypothetical protein
MSHLRCVERPPHDDVARAVELRLKLRRDRPRIIAASVAGHGRRLVVQALHASTNCARGVEPSLSQAARRALLLLGLRSMIQYIFIL